MADFGSYRLFVHSTPSLRGARVVHILNMLRFPLEVGREDSIMRLRVRLRVRAGVGVGVSFQVSGARLQGTCSKPHVFFAVWGSSSCRMMKGFQGGLYPGCFKRGCRLGRDWMCKKVYLW